MFRINIVNWCYYNKRKIQKIYAQIPIQTRGYFKKSF